MPKKPQSQTRQPTASTPFYVIKAELKTFHAQQMYARAFDRFAGAVYLASIILRVFGEESKVRELEGVIDERINRLFESLRAEHKRLQVAAEAEGISMDGVEYSKPQTIEARVSSPRSGRFLGVLREFDGLVQMYDAMWLSGAIPDADYHKHIYDWKRQILRAAGHVSNITTSAMRAAKKRGVTVETENKPEAPTAQTPSGSNEATTDTKDAKETTASP